MKVRLYGASGHAKVILDIAKSIGYEVAGIYDDNSQINLLQGIPVSHSMPVANEKWIISIGANAVRKRIVNSNQLDFIKLLHQHAIVSDSVVIGEGTVLMAGGIVNSGTKIGKHVIINTNSSVDHDCQISDFVHVSPGATLCGNVEVGEGSHIGARAVIIPGVKIGKWVKVGAGSVVISDVPDGVTVVGNPGMILNRK